MVAPKIDILLAEDDTGSELEIFNTIAQEMPSFLLRVDAKGWDYHFATIPLTTIRPISQIVASKFDSNWGSQWIPPYPGAQPYGPDTVPYMLFRGLFDYTDFLTKDDINSSLNGFEPGLENIRSALYNLVPGTGFMRPDAMLEIIVVSNGEDTSGVTFCTTSDGQKLPCEQVGYPQFGTEQKSLTYYQTQFANVKSDPNLLQMHALVANEQTSDCLGGPSEIGYRYQEMAANLHGESYDLCNQSMNDLLTSLGDRLQTTRGSYRTHYLFIDQAPDPSTISVIRLVGGDPGNTVTIPQDAQNGWSYDGYLTNVYAVDSPVPMDMASGFAIELHGSAELSGSDTASVSFSPATGTGTGN